MQARVNWAFAEVCDRAQNVAEVQAAFMREIRALGFTHAACASHVDPLNPPADAVMMVDYPLAWLERFSAKKYAKRDPVYWAARRQTLPFQWSDQRFRKGLAEDQLRILSEAADVGLRDGITIPIHAPDALPASCSLVIGPDGVDPLNAQKAHWYGVYAHECARRLRLVELPPKPELSPRERQCVQLLGQGKDDGDMAIILGLSEHTVHNVVRRAMHKYGVASRVQAFVRALKDGQIRLEDVAA
ncbi:MAG: LuxR family transcriptional regulator [Hyphomonadaceae bacterium]|nr:LuxR family transcriptional regulator [Hyphomonadaceae bacterium]